MTTRLLSTQRIVNIASDPATGSAGEIYYNTTDNVLKYYDGTSWTQFFSSQIKHLVKNDSGTTLNKGTVVYTSGANGTNILVKAAQAVTDSLSAQTLGFLETTLAPNGIGYAVTNGLITGLDTSSASAGSAVWLSPTVAGGVVYGLANKPEAPNHLVYLGVVTRSSSNNGEIFVHISNGWEIEELHDVRITNASNENLLIYNSASAIWINSSSSSLSLAKIKASDTYPTNIEPNMLWFNSNDGNFYIYYVDIDGGQWVQIGGTDQIINSIDASVIYGTISASVLGNSNVYIGTTAIPLNRSSGSQTLTGISIDGNAATVTNGALTTGTLGQFAATTSAQLAGVISDETGSGSLVFATSPTLAGTVSTSAITMSGILTTSSYINRTSANGNSSWLQQDGTGRVHWYWNTLGGTSPTFTNAVEDASALTLHVNNNGNGGSFFHRSVNGASASAGGAISWTTTLYVDLNNITFKGSRIPTVSDNLSAFSSTTSSQLAGIISDETGSGALVFATSPTLTTPNIGVATGTSFNSITGLSSTNPAMDGTVAVGTGTTVARADHVHPTDTSRAPLASPTFTGTPAAPTAAVDTNTTQIATTAYVIGQGYAKLASPTFTGTPSAPTAVADTNTTQLATTAFVIAQASSANPAALGAVAVGTSTRYARADHVHPTTGLGLTSGTLAQFAATTSSQLAGVISDETGSGSLVFATSPSLTTPNIGAATGTSLSVSANITVSTGNATGGGIILADDGDIVDLNDGFASMRFSNGVRIFSGNRTGSAVITLSNSGSGTFTGTIIAPAATTSIPSIRLPHGTAPTAPTNGDIWTTTAGLYAQVNGTTVGPLGTSSGGGGIDAFFLGGM